MSDGLIQELSQQIEECGRLYNVLSSINGCDKLKEFISREGERTNYKLELVSRINELRNGYEPESAGYNICINSVNYISWSITSSVELSDRLLELMNMSNNSVKDCVIHSNSYIIINVIAMKLASSTITSLHLIT